MHRLSEPFQKNLKQNYEIKDTIVHKLEWRWKNEKFNKKGKYEIPTLKYFQEFYSKMIGIRCRIFE